MAIEEKRDNCPLNYKPCAECKRKKNCVSLSVMVRPFLFAQYTGLFRIRPDAFNLTKYLAKVNGYENRK